jgi:hypothetical protein
MTHIITYHPYQKYTRIYFSVTPEQTRFDLDKDTVWEHIKTHYYGVETGKERHQWSDNEEEQEERDKWFECWDDEDFWSTQTTSIVLDSNY